MSSYDLIIEFISQDRNIMCKIMKRFCQAESESLKEIVDLVYGCEIDEYCEGMDTTLLKHQQELV